MEQTLHEKLVEKALPHIEMFKDDLMVHDKAFIERNPVRPFLHFTGSTGTTVIPLLYKEDYPPGNEQVKYLFGRANKWHILEEKTALLESIQSCNRTDLIQYFNGLELLTVTYERAQRVLQEYTRKMRTTLANH